VRQRYRALLAYDGTDYQGFQVQSEARTVQGEVEAALKRVTQTFVRVTGAGRTDAGVHASGQVIAFDSGWRHTTAVLQRALNAVLPADVSLRELTVAPPGFQPRFDATGRTYHYRVLCQPVPDPLSRLYTYHVSQPLELQAMQQACQYLVGTHDFASFGKPPQGKNSVRTVTRAEWHRQGPYLVFVIGADAFLYRMVRTIVGLLLQVGRGERVPEKAREILAARDRAQVRVLAPAHGLCLVEVDYPASVLTIGH
jgi:tRNA pseudouridine38-40 synthase